MANNDDIIETIAQETIKLSKDWPLLKQKLTLPRAQAFILQHIIRNRLLSTVQRPAWLSRCPDYAVVIKTIGQMNEEMVYDANIGAGHTKLLWQMGRNLGLTDAQMNTVKAHPTVNASFNIMENLCRNRHWIIGWLSTSVDEFVLTAQEGETNFHASKWKKDLGLSHQDVFFFSYHEKADQEHGGRDVWKPIRNHVHSPELRDDIIDGLRTAMNASAMFYQGVDEYAKQLEAGLAA